MAVERRELGLEGRAVLVTGAGRGLGRAYAACLARHGARVVVHDAGVDEDGGNPDLACAEAVAEELRGAGGTAFAVTEVLRDRASCRRVVDAALDYFGRLDALIHNAGLVVWRDPAEVDEVLYATLSGVNTEAAFWLCSAALPAMRAAGFGRIVLTTTGWALGPSEGSDELVLYSHGKGAQLGLAMALAKGAGHPGILTNAIAPVANTRMFKGAVPRDRLKPELVAGAVAWLASPACGLTGCLVRASDGTLALVRLTDVATRELGESASDPAAAGTALAEMADAVGGH
jgi:NAD(P)-dependent dehydrogenase (short-subunit alcohol dehydrogenase family)